MQNILSDFLNAGLMPIGEDDEKLKLLEAASSTLAKEIIASPLRAYRLALVGLDDRTDISDPTVQWTASAVLEQWQTLVNKVGAGPIQVYRGVMLRALELAASNKPNINHAISLIVQNEPTLHLKGKERGVIDAMIGRVQSDLVAEMAENWISPVDLTLPKLSGKLKKPLLSKDDFRLALFAASGPQDKEGKQLATPNPYWPNSGQPWSLEFAGRAADAIYAAIQSAYAGIPEELKTTIGEAIKDLVTGVERLAIRDAKCELLWMRTSMYSPSARRGYRELPITEMLLHAVSDVSRAVGPTGPPSVEFYLRDLVASLSNKKLRISKFLTEIHSKLSLLPNELSIGKDDFPTTGRRPWLDIATKPDSTSSFESQSGVSDTYEELAPELAVKLYRELQIRKLLS